MNFSLALTILFLGASVTLSNADGPEDWVRERLEQGIASQGMGGPEEAERRRLDDYEMLHEDFSDFVGTWYDCMHTTLMTFGGENAPKHVVEQVGCEGGELGEITRVGNNDQSMQMDIYILNHCFFWDLGGPGQEPCPDDLLESDERGPGNVLVKYQYFGIGSFAEPDKIHMASDHTFIKNATDQWVASSERAKIENKDTMTCTKYLNGIVCDWRINEYRTSTREIPEGCKKNGECKPNMDKRKCSRKGGEWTDECASIEYTPDGFTYDSFGSYYLVKDLSECNVECATDAPTFFGQTRNPELRTEGCYQGGTCSGRHGCCDCTISEEDCTDGTWQLDGCDGICDGMVPMEDPGCYQGGTCGGRHGCCDCTMSEDECDGFWQESGCGSICD